MERQELIQLNVGGVKYTTTVTTLLCPQAQQSMLARLIELHQRTATDQAGQPSSDAPHVQPALNDPRINGSLFIDRDGTTFRYILAYLRDGDKFIPPGDLQATQELLLEASYFQLDGLVQLLQAHEQKLQSILHEEQRSYDYISKTSAASDAIFKSVTNSSNKLDGIHDLLGDLRSYLAPEKLFHLGKRGGPNRNKRRKLLDDLEDIMPQGK